MTIEEKLGHIEGALVELKIAQETGDGMWSVDLTTAERDATMAAIDIAAGILTLMKERRL